MRTVDVVAAAVIALPLVGALAVPASAASYTNALNGCYAQIEEQTSGEVRTHRMARVKSRPGQIHLWIDTRFRDGERSKSFCAATSSGKVLSLATESGKWSGGNYNQPPFSSVVAR